MGTPPVTSRTRSASSAKSAAVRRSVNVGGDTASWPSGRPRTTAIFPFTLLPGRWPPVPVLAPWPPLKWNACTLRISSMSKPNFADASSYR